jgi:hypothetical protein
LFVICHLFYLSTLWSYEIKIKTHTLLELTQYDIMICVLFNVGGGVAGSELTDQKGRGREMSV